MFAHSTWNAANLYGGSLAALSKRDKGENFQRLPNTSHKSRVQTAEARDMYQCFKVFAEENRLDSIGIYIQILEYGKTSS